MGLTLTALAVQHRESIIAQVSKGVRLDDIIASLNLNITKGAITHAIGDDPEYQAARLDGLASRLDNRETELEGAQDQLNLARARELLSHARWRCETEGRSIWGKQSAINVQAQDGKVSITLIDSYATGK